MSIRVFALAKKLGLDSKDLITALSEAGIFGKKSALAELSPQEVRRFANWRTQQSQPAAQKPKTTSVEIALLPISGEHKLTRDSSNKKIMTGSAPWPEFDEPIVPVIANGTATPGRILGREYIGADNPGIERLLDLGARIGLDQLEIVALVSVIDPESALFKIRQITERFCRYLLGAEAAENMNESVNRIEKRKLLGKKALTYLRKVREIANLAVHGTNDLFDESFTSLDVNHAAEALAIVLSHAVDTGLLPLKSRS